MDQSFSKPTIFTPGPLTNRGHRTSIDSHTPSQLVAYGSGNQVILVNANDISKSSVLCYHKGDVTAVRFNQAGNWIASGDDKGQLLITEIEARHVHKNYENAFAGPIRDLAFTADNQRVLVVGEGKQFYGKVIMVDTGSGQGEITGISKPILSGDLKANRPFKLAIGGEEYTTYIYEGPPFKYKKSTKDHTNFVNQIRYNPIGDHFVTVSSDKKILLYKSDTNDLVKEIGAHELSVMSVAWIDDTNLVTCSNDKTVRLWNFDGLTKTFKIAEQPEILDFQVGVTVVGNRIFSVSLRGTLNVFDNFQTKQDGSFPDIVFNYHQKPIQKVAVLNEDTISGDQLGVILYWKNGKSSVFQGKPHTSSIVDLQITQSKATLVSVDTNGLVSRWNLSSHTQESQTSLEGSALQLRVSKVNENISYVLFENKIVVLNADQIEKTIQLKENGVSFDIVGNDELIAVGGETGFVNLINLEGKQEFQLQVYQQRITFVKQHKNILAAGDNTGKIKLFDWNTKEELTDKFSNHSASITSLSFYDADNVMLSSSLDNKVILWSTQTLKKILDIVDLHKKGVNDAHFDSFGDIISGGGDNLVKRTKK